MSDPKLDQNGTPVSDDLLKTLELIDNMSYKQLPITKTPFNEPGLFQTYDDVIKHSTLEELRSLNQAIIENTFVLNSIHNLLAEKLK